jgi:hypothetical protein
VCVMEGMVGRDSSVGIATSDWLDGPEIESRWGRDFLHWPLGPPSLLYNGYRISFPGVKRPGLALTTHTHQTPRLKKEYSYTFTPPVGLLGRFWGEIYLYWKESRSLLGTYLSIQKSLIAKTVNTMTSSQLRTCSLFLCFKRENSSPNCNQLYAVRDILSLPV